MKVGESSPLYETHSCLHENDGARLDRSLMTILKYGEIGRDGDESDLSLQMRSDRVAFGPSFYRLVRKFFTACKLHRIFCFDREIYFPMRIHIYLSPTCSSLSFVRLFIVHSLFAFHNHFFYRIHRMQWCVHSKISRQESESLTMSFYGDMRDQDFTSPIGVRDEREFCNRKKRIEERERIGVRDIEKDRPERSILL